MTTNPHKALADLKSINADLGKRSVSTKALEAFATRLDDIFNACLEIERVWMSNPPHRVASELAPFEVSWSLQMARFERCYGEISTAARKSPADNIVVNLALNDAIDRTGARLISLLDLPCALKTSRATGPVKVDRQSDYSPAVKAMLLDAASRKPETKPEGSE